MELENGKAHIGWWCWRCENINEQPCKSDSVELFANPEWVYSFQEYILEREEEG